MNKLVNNLLSTKAILIFALVLQMLTVVYLLGRYINVELNGIQKVIPVIFSNRYEYLRLEAFIPNEAFQSYHIAIFGRLYINKNAYVYRNCYDYPLKRAIPVDLFSEAGLLDFDAHSKSKYHRYEKCHPAELLIKTDGQNVIIQDLLIANQPLNEFIKAHMLKKGETP